MAHNTIKRGMYGGLCAVFSASVGAQTVPEADVNSLPDDSSISNMSSTPYETATAPVEPTSGAWNFPMIANPFAPAEPTPEPTPMDPAPADPMPTEPEPTPPSHDDTCSVSLSWDMPISRENGEDLALWEIGGYEIHYYEDQNEGEFNIVDINDSYQTEYTFSDLSEGFYHFAIGTYDIDGLKSDLSEVVSVICEPD